MCSMVVILLAVCVEVWICILYVLANSVPSLKQVPQRSSSRRRHVTTSNKRSERTLETPTNSQGTVNRPEESSPAITQEGSSSLRIGQLTPQMGLLQCADDRVLARWKDCQWYPGTIQENLSNGKYVYILLNECMYFIFINCYQGM